MIEEVLSHQYMVPSNARGLLFRDLRKESASCSSKTSHIDNQDQLLLPHFENGTFKSDLPTKKKNISVSRQVATSTSTSSNNWHFAKYLEEKEKIRVATATSKNREELANGIWWFRDKVIAYGGYTTTYEGQQKDSNSFIRSLAIKITSGFSGEFIESLPSHPNVVSIIQVVELPDMRPFLVTERCHSLTLKDYIEERKKNKIPFDFNLALVHAKQAVNGLHHLHKNGIRHGYLDICYILLSLDMQSLKISVVFMLPDWDSENDIHDLGRILNYLWTNGEHDEVADNPDNLLIPFPSLALDFLKLMQSTSSSIEDVNNHDFWKRINI